MLNKQKSIFTFVHIDIKKGSIINVGVRKPNEKNKLSIFEKTFKM